MKSGWWKCYFHSTILLSLWSHSLILKPELTRAKFVEFSIIPHCMHHVLIHVQIVGDWVVCWMNYRPLPSKDQHSVLFLCMMNIEREIQPALLEIWPHLRELRQSWKKTVYRCLESLPITIKIDLISHLCLRQREHSHIKRAVEKEHKVTSCLCAACSPRVFLFSHQRVKYQVINANTYSNDDFMHICKYIKYINKIKTSSICRFFSPNFKNKHDFEISWGASDSHHCNFKT